jgi:hypothetical protein
MATEDLTGSESARQVRIKDVVPVIFRIIESRGAFGSTRRVHQNVYFAERLNAFV